MKLSAVIFDLNGTVLADELIWGRAFRKVLADLGRKVEDKYPHTGGIGIDENWPKLLDKYKIKTDKSIEELSEITKNYYLQNIDEIELKKGIVEYISELRQDGILTALATSSTWGTVEKIFDKFNIETLFDCVTTGEEVNIKKPDPEIFMLTANKLGVDPSECVVFEDSQAGIEAAKSAGMKAVGIYRDIEHRKELSKADMVVKDFSKLKSEELYGN